MVIEHYHNKLRYTLSNDNLKVGDLVYPIAEGRCLDDGGWILHNFDFRDFCSGFPDEPHTILNLNYSTYKPEEVRTSHGFGPIEMYYKIIKVEERIVEYHEPGPSGLKLTKRNEWVVIKK
jgi:hypothetical protein